VSLSVNRNGERESGDLPGVRRLRETSRNSGTYLLNSSYPGRRNGKEKYKNGNQNVNEEATNLETGEINDAQREKILVLWPLI